MTDPVRNIPVAGLLHMAYNILSAQIFETIAAAGYSDLRPAHGNVFEQLTYEDGLRLTDLAAHAGMTAQSMSELVDDLAQRGYVERRPDLVDRRAKRIHLTEKGRANVHVGIVAAQEADDYIIRLIGEERERELRNILEQIVSAPERQNHQ